MKRILILGGDARQVTVMKEMKNSGYNPDVYCLGKANDGKVPIISENRYDIVISGLPVTRDNIYINTPLSDNRFKICYLKELIIPGGYFLGGLISPQLEAYLKDNGINTIDYFQREELIIKNIVPTVEGCLSIAINESPITLFSSRCLITGYGRIGKYLAKILKYLGADVTVSARNPKDLTWIEVNGYSSVLTSQIKDKISQYDFIFNTVPVNIINSECIENIRKDCLVIELASYPGGIDKGYAENNGIKVISAPSLPGKTAPVTAGKIIKDTLVDIIETEVK